MSNFDYTAYDQFIDWQLSDYNLCLKPFLSDFFTNNQFQNILDIGFGSGFLAKILHQTGFQNPYLGIDINPQALDHLKKQNLPQNFNFRLYSPQLELKNFALVVASLSLIEMSDEVINTYFALQPSQQVLIIQPASLTFTYPSKVIKKFPTRLTQFLGAKPNWQVLVDIPEQTDQKPFYTHKIKGQNNLPSNIYFRSAGQLLKLMSQNHYNLQNYWELSVDYQKASQITNKPVQYLQRKIAPVAKFEIYLFSFK
jgi:SAM-dependent methyltransferase